MLLATLPEHFLHSKCPLGICIVQGFSQLCYGLSLRQMSLDGLQGETESNQFYFLLKNFDNSSLKNELQWLVLKSHDLSPSLPEGS